MSEYPAHSPNIDEGVYSEGQFTRPRPECPNPEHWTTPDIQGTPFETIELVAGLIRGLQPEVVLETGTSRGHMAKAIGNALKANGHGQLYTYEPEEPTWREACHTVHSEGQLDTIVMCQNEPSMQPWEHTPIEFAWFDSLTSLRWPEFDYYYQYMNVRTVVGFHDTAPHFGQWTSQVYNDPRLMPLPLPTPRGVILARVIGAGQ